MGWQVRGLRCEGEADSSAALRSDEKDRVTAGTECSYRALMPLRLNCGIEAMTMRLTRWCGVVVLAGLAAVAAAQPRPQKPLPDVSQTSSGAPHRTRLILKDGSYQLVMSYAVKGKLVSYVSAERGEVEEIPNDLVDWDATHKWEREHAAHDDAQAPAPQINPELLKEEQERRKTPA